MNSKCNYTGLAICLLASIGTILSTPARAASAAPAQPSSGWEQLQLNNVAAAKTDFLSEIARDPADAAARHGLAVIDTMENGAAASEEFAAVVKQAPNEPYAWSDWHNLLTSTTYFGISAQASNTWRALASDAAAPAALRFSELEAVAESDRLHGDIIGAKAVWNKLDYVRAWKTIGPFDNVSKSGFKKLFEPEVDGIKLDAQMTGKDDLPVQWRTLPLVLDDGTCELGSFLGDNASSVFYSATSVESPGDRSATLWFSPTGASKVWINGELVLTDDIYRSHAWGVGDTFAVPVHLKAGGNTILVKSADDNSTAAAFLLRFTDTAGGAPIGLIADPSKASGVPQVAAPGFMNAQPALVELAKRAPVNRLNLEALAELQQDYSDYDAARDTIQQAIKLAPGDAWLQWEYANILSSAGQQDDFRTARDAARAAEPDNIIAQESYVDDEDTKTPADQRIALIRGLLKRHPHSPLLLVALSGVLEEQKLTQQGLNTLVQAYAVAPGTYVAQVLSAIYSSLDRTQNQLSFDQAALAKTPGDTDLLADEAGILDSQGKFPAAIAVYEKTSTFGDNKIGVLKEIAGVYVDAHQTKSAIAETRKILDLRPEDADLRGQLADMYSDAGQKPQALALYQQAIALDPSQVSLRDKIRLIRGDKPVLDLAPAINAEPLLAAAKSKATAASTGVVRYILDEEREVVYGDGAVEHHFHEILRIQDHAAIDRYSSFPLAIQSSTAKMANLRARLIKLNGKVIYPDTDDATTSVDFPSLDVGDIIDVEYDVTDYQSGALAHNFWDKWYFDHHGEDFDISHFALITPKTMKLTIAAHGSHPEMTQKDVDDWTIREWKATNIAAKPVEPESPGGFDIDDWLDVSTVSSWSDIVAWYTDLSNSACTPDDTIRAKAADLTQGDTTDDQRIQHIVKFVRSLRYQSTPFRLSAYVPTEGKQVIRDLYGDCKDKAALLCSLLNSVGVQAQMILLSPRNIGITPMLPSPRFDHAIARIKTDSGWQWEDATADQMQYGYLPYQDQGVPALIIAPGTTDLSTSPVGKASDEYQTSKMELALQTDGSIKGNYDADFVGNTAWVVRSYVQMLGAARHDQLIAGMASRIFPGSASDGGSFDGIDTPDGHVTMKLAFHEDNYAASTGTLMLVKLPWAGDMSANISEIDGPTGRTTPLEIGLDRCTQSDTIHISLPAGYKPDSLEQPVKIASQWGECDFGFSSDATGITATRTLRIDPLRISLTEMPGYIAFLKQVAAESSKQIVVKSGS